MTTTGSDCIVFCLISFSYVISLWGFLYEKINVRSTFRNNYFTPHVVINTIAVVIVLILAFLNRL